MYFQYNYLPTVVVFGASGFLGRYVVALLAKNNFLIKACVRSPSRARHLLVNGKLGQVSLLRCNISDPESVNSVIDKADVVINLVGILTEYRKQTFKNIHLDGAINIAKACKKYNIKSLVHVSALSVDRSLESNYAKSKFAAEKCIKTIFKNVTIVRPSVIYGAEDDFTNKFAKMALISPFIPIINQGLTKFQPVNVLDVAKAIEKIVLNKKLEGNVYCLGGPEIFSFREIIDLIMKNIGKDKTYINLSFFNAKILAFITSIFPNAPITLDQLKLLKVNNIVPPKSKGFKHLGINPTSLQIGSKKYLSRYKTSY